MDAVQVDTATGELRIGTFYGLFYPPLSYTERRQTTQEPSQINAPGQMLSYAILRQSSNGLEHALIPLRNDPGPTIFRRMQPEAGSETTSLPGHGHFRLSVYLGPKRVATLPIHWPRERAATDSGAWDRFACLRLGALRRPGGLVRVHFWMTQNPDPGRMEVAVRHKGRVLYLSGDVKVQPSSRNTLWQRIDAGLFQLPIRGGMPLTNQELLAQEGDFELVALRDGQVDRRYAFRIANGRPVRHVRQAFHFRPYDHFLAGRRPDASGQSDDAQYWIEAVQAGKQPAVGADPAPQLVETDVPLTAHAKVLLGPNLIVVAEERGTPLRYLIPGTRHAHPILGSEEWDRDELTLWGAWVMTSNGPDLVAFDTRTSASAQTPRRLPKPYAYRRSLRLFKPHRKLANTVEASASQPRDSIVSVGALTFRTDRSTTEIKYGAPLRVRLADAWSQVADSDGHPIAAIDLQAGPRLLAFKRTECYGYRLSYLWWKTDPKASSIPTVPE